MNIEAEQSKFWKYGYWLLLTGIFGWAVFTRFGDLDADPAFHLSKSAGYMFDPFSHSGNARSFLLFGDLHPDQWNTYIYSPLYVLLQVVWFWVFGISIKTMHAYGAMWSVLGLAISWLAFSRFGKLAGLFSLIFFSSHYIFSQFGRMALLENAAMFFIAVIFLSLSLTLTRKRAFWCGVFCFLTFAAKATTFFVIPAAGLAVFVAAVQCYLETGNRKDAIALVVSFVAGMLTVFLPWLFLFRIPNNEEIMRVGEVWIKSLRLESLEDSLNNLINDRLFLKIDRHDLLSVIVLVVGGVTLYRLLSNWRALKPITIMMFFAMIGGALFVGVLGYKPTRFALPLLPMMFGLAAIGLSEFYQSAELRSDFKRWWAADISAVFTLTLIFRMIGFLHAWPREQLEKLPGELFGGQWDSLFQCFVAALGVWLLIRVALFVFVRNPIEIPKWLRVGLISMFVAHFLYGNFSATHRWLNDRNYTIRMTNTAIQDHPQMVVGGLSVHAFVMNTQHRAVRIEGGGWHNGIAHRQFYDLGLTHLLLTDYNHLRLVYERNFPNEMKQLKRIDVYAMCGQKYHLYEIPESMRKKPWDPDDKPSVISQLLPQEE